MRYVYGFGDPIDTDAEVGGKAEDLASLASAGFPIPPGFAISAVAGRRYLRTGEFPGAMWEEVIAAMDQLTESVQSSVNVPGRPLLLSARPSPETQMPGFLDSVLHIGVNDRTLHELATWSSERFAQDVHRRFLHSYGTTVRRVPSERFDSITNEVMAARGPNHPLTTGDFAHLAEQYRSVVVEETQRPIPTETLEQLHEALEAVFGSWDKRVARDYRRRHRLSDDPGTAALVHAMIYDYVDDQSGAGVGFTRDPATGDKSDTGSFVVFGHTPTDAEFDAADGGLDLLAELHPEAHAQLVDHMGALELRNRDLCRVDFIVEQGRLWIIQNRNAERTGKSAVVCAVDMATEGLITREEAVLRVDAASLDELLHATLRPGPQAAPIVVGGSASPGAASGEIVFDSKTAVARAEAGAAVILVRHEPTQEDLAGVAAAQGILTIHGGRTSHVAVAARGMSKAAVTGTPGLEVDLEAGVARVGTIELRAGDTITLDGATGRVFRGALPIEPADELPQLGQLLDWADEHRMLQVWANADTPEAAAFARAAGAEGVGLARSEYMFSGERLDVVRTVILTEDARARSAALAALEDLQVGDFERLLETMDGLPVVVRLLDPPLHEFLPGRRETEQNLARARDEGRETADLERLEAAISRWEESNPMLGLRGVRLAVIIPQLYRIQVLAALEAVRRRLDAGGDPRLQLMVPLVASTEELHLIRDMIEEEIHYAGRQLEVTIGTMIELPRAALVASDIARDADFFSFGTNDLTQTTMGLSRDDAEKAFLGAYLDRGLLQSNPFATIDAAGVGKLIRMAVADGRAANPQLEIGVCGEHGADPQSIDFFHEVGVDYVSCSPPAIPVARLAAAQAALRRASGTDPG